MDYWHYNFICPYFKWDEKQRVGCEGKHVLKFDSANAAKKFMKSYCAGWKWGQCPHAEKMNQEYEGRNNGNNNQRT